MNSLVFLHPQRDPASFTVNRRAQKNFVHREQYRLNPADVNALEAALRASGPVTVVALGDTPAIEDYLRWALALGAQRALQINEPTLATAEAGVVANVLRRVVEYLGDVEAVWLAADFSDADLAQAGPRLAQALGWAYLPNVHAVAPQPEGVQAIAETADGFHQYAAPLLVVVGVVAHSNQPRYAHGGQIMAKYRAQNIVEIFSASAVGVSASDLRPGVETRGESYPPERELGHLLEGDVAEMAHKVADNIYKL